LYAYNLAQHSKTAAYIVGQRAPSVGKSEKTQLHWCKGTGLIANKSESWWGLIAEKLAVCFSAIPSLLLQMLPCDTEHATPIIKQHHSQGTYRLVVYILMSHLITLNSESIKVHQNSSD